MFIDRAICVYILLPGSPDIVYYLQGRLCILPIGLFVYVLLTRPFAYTTNRAVCVCY